ncbi:phospholipase A2 inhibitor gamma subunit B-like isoform X2 [Chelonoidis abingdonii]|uniref:phospholipase A2 inhibitor gamma subunit B-like isoform X2 n=1 Tax=Chelonoidis abingdonii TaxID=106734 RepID=UPI0013F202D0|nr:phospholipase A2 inhibitor subunit gamma B-like isoform X2 [Chelonoidis abingdonii]XP_032659149.1 phospholipase A2 inhibitor subunit gamma B-like isoform X2 [Chelonoidis abingdonii]XP_032659150.1 phospholipase A2 inhibitor subunit gamma B-like isoform X2 [Chelonoidis abingdonii]
MSSGTERRSPAAPFLSSDMCLATPRHHPKPSKFSPSVINYPARELAAFETPLLIYCFRITMAASLAVCILAALLATGTCLQCEVCTGPGKNCTGSMQTCAAGQDSCGIFLTEVIMVGIEIQSILKRCMPSSQCKAGPFSVNFGNVVTSRTIITCCMGDACKTVNVTLPPADTKPNGWSCPGCFALTTEQCREGTIQCTGAETQCIDAVGAIMTGGYPIPTVMKGCVSESMCNHLNVTSSALTGISLNLTREHCTEASAAARVAPGAAGLLFSALAGLLLLTLLS